MRTFSFGALGVVLCAATIGSSLIGADFAGATPTTAGAAASQTVAWGTTSSAPAGTLGELFGVAAASSTDALAVGGFNPGEQPTALLTRPYAEHWNGTGWSATSVPLARGSNQTAQLNGVTAVAPGDGWAVGTVANPSELASRTLAYHWDGTAWTRTPTPDPGGSTLPNALNAVAARSSSDVLAVGGSGYPEVSLVVRWNGSTWRQIHVPNIGPLSAVTVAPGDVWIGGGDQVEQFNGATWTTLPTLPDSPLLTGLADTPTGLWAVGRVDISCGESLCTSSYAAVWNGANWTVTPAGGGTGLSGVVAAGSNVLATTQTEVLRLTLTSAVPQVTPAIDGALNAIGADPSGNPWAVGSVLTPAGNYQPAIINAPGIGQGGIIVTTGAADATVTWTGPVNGAGSTDQGGRFAVGGLPDGSYSVIASLAGCQPGVATAEVTAGLATAVNVPISCPP
jgi:hypothetical protein